MALCIVAQSAERMRSAARIVATHRGTAALREESQAYPGAHSL